jgi:hypothetical protein
VDGKPGNVLAVQNDRSRPCRKQAAQTADQRRLSHSVAPEDSEDLPLPEPKREPLEHLDGAVATVDVASVQHH